MMQRGSSSVQCVVRNSCGFGVFFFFSFSNWIVDAVR